MLVSVEMMKIDYEVYQDAVKAMKDKNIEFTNTKKGEYARDWQPSVFPKRACHSGTRKQYIEGRPLDKGSSSHQSVVQIGLPAIRTVCTSSGVRYLTSCGRLGRLAAFRAVVKYEVGPLRCGDIAGDDSRQQEQENRFDRTQAQRRRERSEGQDQGRSHHGYGRPEQRGTWPALPERSAAAHHEYHKAGGYDRFQEPTGAKSRRVGTHQQSQRAKRRVIEHRTEGAEHEHEIADRADIPATRHGQQFGVNTVGGNGHFRQVGEHVHQQDLLRQQGQKRQKQRGARHAEHVAEVGAGGHVDVFERVGKSRPTFLHAAHQHAKILLQQHDVGGFFGHVDGLRN